uniref:hypothetical protein n=1 Tax=Arthrobacter sp. TaxID=1667 RepID=UPI000EB6B167|nr:hypothetical protein [Arthrobacter sp.]AXV46405.1 hypothetical protein pA40H2_p49 [Arthrobacter sp.]
MTIKNVSGKFLTRSANRFPDMAPAESIPSIKVGAEGYWGIKCVKGHCVPRNMQIPNCVQEDRLGQELYILPEDIALINHPAQNLGRRWFHISKTPWSVPNPDSFTHVGSFEAAKIRGLSLNHPNGSNLYLHEFRLHPESSIAEEIYLESDGFSVEALYELKISDPQTSSIYRYVNREEAPGSISLVVDPAVLQLVGNPQPIPYSS